MLFVHDVHAVMGERELDFEDSVRAEYAPAVGADDDSRLLWYLNFVQVPTMPTIQPVEHRAAISKFIAPNVLFFFRYAALATVITGLLLAWMLGYIVDALLLRKNFVMIGIGMWMALIMAFNVWFIIWPNQQKILGLVEATAEQKAAAAKPALYASRFNTMFSIGMLYCMVAQQNGGL